MLQGLLGHSVQNAFLTFAHSFAELSRNFHEKNLSAEPSHQQGALQTNSKHQGPWCFALAKPCFWKLGCCIWVYQNVSKLFMEPWIYIVLCIYKVYLWWFMISYFRKYINKFYFSKLRTKKKELRGVWCWTCGSLRSLKFLAWTSTTMHPLSPKIFSILQGLETRCSWPICIDKRWTIHQAKESGTGKADLFFLRLNRESFTGFISKQMFLSKDLGFPNYIVV